MLAFEHALLLLLLVSSLSVVARWLPWPVLITYMLGGVGAALLPAFPRFQLDPGFFFLCFLPPLLFADGWLMPLRELFRAKRPILMLAVGLVTFTTVAVGLVAHWLVPGLPLAMAFALGAIVSPTAAAAVTFSSGRMAGEFSVLSIGGLAVGLAVGYGIGKLRDLLRTLRASDT